MIQNDVSPAVEAGQFEVERADVGDADGGAGNGENQRVHRVERAPPRNGGPREEPCDGHADDDTERDGYPRIQEAVHDVLRRLHDHPLVVLEGVGDGERRQCPALADGGEHHAEVGNEREQHHDRQEHDGQGVPAAGQPPALDPRVGERRVVLEADVVPRGEQKQHGEQDHEGGDHDAHAEDAPVHELDDVEVGLGGEDILHAQDERSREVGERPDEDEQRSRDVARRGERQGHRPELPPAPGPDALRRLLERRVDLRRGRRRR